MQCNGIWLSLTHAYRYLFDPFFDNERNIYDPIFRDASDLYNESLKEILKLIAADDEFLPGYRDSFECQTEQFSLSIVMRGNWNSDEIERLEFANDYEVDGLTTKNHTFGLGVPLIAVRKAKPSNSFVEAYYPDSLAFPLTAFMRVVPKRLKGSEKVYNSVTIELYNPLQNAVVKIGEHQVPLESDTSSPIAYFLDDPLLSTQLLATLALLDAKIVEDYRGIYMLEPFDPNRIPVVMVHGLWSSPITWLHMFNELQSDPSIREKYQFWFYLYPTGQPFWESAGHMREALSKINQDFNPRHQLRALNEIVLVGHSMGGLISRMQTVDSGDRFWDLISDQPIDEFEGDADSKNKLKEVFYFKPNPNVSRVVTIATPHHGSPLANQPTRWLSKQLIRQPSMIQLSARNIEADKGSLKDSELFSVRTSIDSLSRSSPIFDALKAARHAPRVRFHNIAGKLPKKDFATTLNGWVVGEGDGVVPIESALLDESFVETQITIGGADHLKIHQHPRTILEVRRILLAHLKEFKEYHGAEPQIKLPDRTAELPSDNGSRFR